MITYDRLLVNTFTIFFVSTFFMVLFLWTRIGKQGEEYQAWKLLGGHNAPNKGDLRTHKGALWESLINGNATEPGSDDRWWKWIKDL